MEKQLVVSISREYGSGGHEIAERLSKRFLLPLYDRNLLDEIARKKNVSDSKLRDYDETPKKLLLSRTVRGYNNSPQDAVAQMQFEFLRNKVKEGESFVVVGRCSEEKLKEVLNDSITFIPIFIRADIEVRVERIMELYYLSHAEALDKIKRHDKNRKAYHNYYCDTKWGDSKNYDITINSGKIGIEETIDILETYINLRQR